jgi:hypothetical protein
MRVSFWVWGGEVLFVESHVAYEQWESVLIRNGCTVRVAVLQLGSGYD